MHTLTNTNKLTVLDINIHNNQSEIQKGALTDGENPHSDTL